MPICLYANVYGGPTLQSDRAFATEWTLVHLDFMTGLTGNSVTFGVARDETDGGGSVWVDNFSFMESP